MKSPLPLVLCLFAVAFAFLGPIAYAASSPELYARVTLWGIPLFMVLAAAFCVPRRLPSASLASRGGPALLVAGAAGLLADQAHLGYGFFARAATFTLGTQRFADGRFAWEAIWALPLWIAFGVFGWERALRSGVFAGFRDRLGTPAAFAVSGLAGISLGLPVILPGGHNAGFVLSGLVALAAREAACTLLFVEGGLLAAGFYRGVSIFVQAFVIDDRYALHSPAFQVVSDAPSFYLARALTALSGVAVIALGVRFAGHGRAHGRFRTKRST